MFSLVCGLLITNSCRKYKDDEFISLKTPFKRIVGHWQIESFLVNDQDSSYHVYNKDSLHNGYYLKDLQLDFTNQKDYSYFIEDGPNNFIGIGNPNNRTAFGFWQLNSNNTYVEISGFNFEYRVPATTETLWKILKLTKTEFHVEANYNNKFYKIYFTKY